MKTQAARVAKNELSNDRRTLDAATIVIDPEFNEEGKYIGLRFGSTNGGVTFNAEVAYRTREYDGTSGFATMGDQVVESASVTATAQVSELTTAILQKVMKADIEDLDNGRKRIKPQRNIRATDYIDTIGLVGWLPNGDSVIIELYNVLITSPLNYVTEDNGDMTMEVEFTAHIDPSDLANIETVNDLPYSIITPEWLNPTDGELQEALTEEGTE